MRFVLGEYRQIGRPRQYKVEQRAVAIARKSLFQGVLSEVEWVVAAIAAKPRGPVASAGGRAKLEESAMREIASGIYTWSKFSEPHGYDFNGHLVRDAGGNICIDPVEPSAEDLAEIKRLGVARIVLTNRNHSRAAKLVRAATGAPVAIHPADAPHAKSQGTIIDEKLAVGQRIGPFTVVAAAGKSPGEVALHWPERRLLIIGDAVIGNPPGKCGLLREQVMDEPVTLRRSIAKLLELDFDMMLVGDGVSILKGAKERLNELVASFAS